MPAVAKPFPAWLARSRAWISMILLAPAAWVAVFSESRLSLESFGDLAFNCLGWLLFFVGAGFRWWATLFIGGRKDCQVVDQGAYSVCRNPLYFGTFLLTISIAALLQSVVFLVATLLVTAYYVSVTVPVEEQRLLSMYGDEYARYLKRVPRFFPKFSLLRTPSLIEVRVSGLYAELLRTLRWILIPMACQLLVHLQHQEWWPRWANLP